MRYAGPGVGSYAGLGSFLISEKRLIKPTKTGASPRSVQTKVEPEVVLAPKTTTKIPKAINPAEIRSANILSIFLVSAFCLSKTMRRRSFARQAATDWARNRKRPLPIADAEKCR
jgi:hypothetical protein